ncbi:hypothetical protein KSP40_PGU015057 [Platanthera guangdongensis]|uniref:lipid-A-disaccharide synthase n=1 Tax=Platanthera guangdongensis TaxID=2320717 RepID=A0ABR2MTE1_9ASPA
MSHASVARTHVSFMIRGGRLRVAALQGQVSGGQIHSRLACRLRRVSPFHVFIALVSCQTARWILTLMYQEGLKSLFLMEDISVMGIFELLPYLNRIRIQLNETIEAAVLFQAHVVVTVDSKGFSFRLLKFLKARYTEDEDSPICVHYVAPSFWAWKGGERRLGKLSEFVDYMLCILPFEEEICRSNGLAAAYVGHPSLEDALYLNMELDKLSNNWRVRGNGDAFRQQHGIPPENKIITLLPGSRLQEVKRMLPIFSRTIELLNDSFSRLSVVIPVAPHQHVASHVEREIYSWSFPSILISGKSLHQRYDAFSASRAALCTSGSAVMELQLAGVPSVVAYRAHFLTEWLIRHRTKLRFISLPNILLDSEVIPEVLFHSCTCKNLAATLSNIIRDEDSQRKQMYAADNVFRQLCPQGLHSITENSCPSMNAASIILNVAKQK